MKATTLNTPAFKTVSKIGFILTSAIFTSTVLLLYSYLLKGLIPSSNQVREYCICFGQIAYQGSILLFTAKKEMILEYLFQMMKVSLAGAFLLTPVLLSSFLFFSFSPGVYYYAAYFFVIVLYMFFNHKKRIESIHAPRWLAYTWVLYRLLVLIIIL